ncbi:MAG: hypothetical protein ABRQ39_16245 [Candidatus Eremiobacterota bacterium]
MKKFYYVSFSILLITILCIQLPSYSASQEANVYVNKELITTVPVIYKANQYYAPLSILEDAFYMAVSYDPTFQLAAIEDTVEQGDTQYSLNHYWYAVQVGNNLLVKNSPKQEKLKVTNLKANQTPILMKGQVYVPISFFGVVVAQATYEDGDIVFDVPERTMDEREYRQNNTIATGKQFTVTPEMALKLAGSLLKGSDGTIKIPIPQIE